MTIYEIITIGPGFMILAALFLRVIRPISDHFETAYANEVAFILSLALAAITLWLVINGSINEPDPGMMFG